MEDRKQTTGFDKGNIKPKKRNPNANMRGKMPREKKALRESGLEVILSDEDLDKAVATLRANGYKYGTLRGTPNCRVSLWKLEDHMQLTFMRSCVHVTDLETRRRFKIEYKNGFDVKPDGSLDIDVNRGVEIQL